MHMTKYGENMRHEAPLEKNHEPKGSIGQVHSRPATPCLAGLWDGRSATSLPPFSPALENNSMQHKLTRSQVGKLTHQLLGAFVFRRSSNT
jgi:hypothetical protein